MSRHVPLTCRDPFMRDFEREFFDSKGSSRHHNTWEGIPSKLFDQVKTN